MKEIELCQIIEKLQTLDKQDDANESMKYRLTSIEHDELWDQSQRKLLQEYEEKVLSYCEEHMSTIFTPKALLMDFRYFG